MKLPWFVFGLICVTVGIVLALLVTDVKATSFCQVRTGWRQDFPGWGTCPFDGQFLVGSWPGGVTCATPEVVCE